MRSAIQLVRGAGHLRDFVSALREEGELGYGDKSTSEDMELKAGAGDNYLFIVFEFYMFIVCILFSDASRRGYELMEVMAASLSKVMECQGGMDKRMYAIEERVTVDSRARKAVDFFVVRQEIPFDDNIAVNFFFRDPLQVIGLLEWCVKSVPWDKAAFATNILKTLMTESYMAQYTFPAIA